MNCPSALEILAPFALAVRRGVHYSGSFDIGTRRTAGCAIIEEEGRSDMRKNWRWRVSDDVAKLVRGIAAIYSPSTALDPSCTDISLLSSCDFVASRRALFRSDEHLESATVEHAGIDCVVYDITQEPSPEKADLIVTLLPSRLASREEGRLGHFDLQIAQRCLPMVAKDGVALILTTPNYLTAPLYAPFRNHILDQFSLDAVVELSRGSISKSGIELALLVLRNGPARTVGTFLGKFTTHNPHEIIAAIRNGEGELFVPTESLHERWDCNFHDPRHQGIESSLDAIETRNVTDFGEVYRGRIELRNHLKDFGEYLVLSVANVQEGQIVSTERSKYVDDLDEEWFDDIVLRPGDIVISLVRPTAYVYRETDPPAVIGHNMVAISTEDNDYLASYLNTPQGREQFSLQAERRTTGVQIQRLSVRELENIRIPVLPLQELNSIGNQHIATASSSELEALRTELLQVKHQLEFTEAQLANERASRQDRRDSSTEVPGLQFFNEQFGKIEASLNGLHQKVDNMARALSTIAIEIGSVKESSREDEEKLAQIEAKLDRFVETSATEQRTLREFVVVVQRWLCDWDSLEQLTQIFLPSAEQIYDLLQRNETCDYSPFVVQYCRAFENEILIKLFHAYSNDLIMRKAEIPDFVAMAKGNQNTKTFAKILSTKQLKYTLGEMSFIMSLIAPGGSTLASVRLLQDFREFVISSFGEQIAEKPFLDQIKRINETFRTKSAHPYLISKSDADQCMKEVRAVLLELLDAYRGNGGTE